MGNFNDSKLQIMGKVLITGASGLVGTRLTEVLLLNQFEVAHLGRSKRPSKVPSFLWDVNHQQMDPKSLEGVGAIVHLAGAGIADKRWNTARKKEILDSRVHSTRLLYTSLKNNAHQIKVVVAASAIGYYGFGLSDQEFREEDAPANDFLAEVTRQWEDEIDQIEKLGIRVVKIRIGIVLSNRGGALIEISKPIRLGFGATLATGLQIISWIHLDDLCEMFLKAINDYRMIGAYNGVAPNPVSNKKLTEAIAQVFQKRLWLPSVPSFVLRLVVGEMAQIVVNGCKVSSHKILSTGFTFKFPIIEEALMDLFEGQSYKR
ncbi:MAG: TIGR01777 family oxidoreductase [Flammeovirgaceae bacterium]